MPLFAYKCKNDHAEDNIVSFSKREEPQVCSECGEPSYFKTTFCTTFHYSEDYSSFASDAVRWKQRENHRLGKG